MVTKLESNANSLLYQQLSITAKVAVVICKLSIVENVFGIVRIDRKTKFLMQIFVSYRELKTLLKCALIDNLHLISATFSVIDN